MYRFLMRAGRRHAQDNKKKCTACWLCPAVSAWNSPWQQPTFANARSLARHLTRNFHQTKYPQKLMLATGVRTWRRLSGRFGLRTRTNASSTAKPSFSPCRCRCAGTSVFKPSSCYRTQKRQNSTPRRCAMPISNGFSISYGGAARNILQAMGEAAKSERTPAQTPHAPEAHRARKAENDAASGDLKKFKTPVSWTIPASLMWSVQQQRRGQSPHRGVFAASRVTSPVSH